MNEEQKKKKERMAFLRKLIRKLAAAVKAFISA